MRIDIQISNNTVSIMLVFLHAKKMHTDGSKDYFLLNFLSVTINYQGACYILPSKDNGLQIISVH